GGAAGLRGVDRARRAGSLLVRRPGFRLPPRADRVHCARAGAGDPRRDRRAADRGGMRMAVYLGIDSSTQSLSAVAIEGGPGAGGRRAVAAEASVPFSELPRHGTRNGVLPSADPRLAHSPPLLWVEALDLVFPKLRAAGLDLARVRAIAGSGQQHGSV